MAQDCSQYVIKLTSQSDVDDFQATYGAGALCDRLQGSLEVSGEDIFNLQGLNAIKQIDGTLSIHSNTLLVDLSGLEQLEVVMETIYIADNDNLKSLDGLSALQTNGHPTNFEFEYFFILRNPVLEDVDALQNYVFARALLRILDNPSLKNLDGFSNLYSAMGLTIGRNASLQSLSGLSTVKGAVLRLGVYDNPELASLDGLNGINNVMENLGIYRNSSLMDIQALEAIHSVGGVLYLDQNPSLANCSVLQKLLDEVDDPPNGPGPGSGGIPDIAEWAEVHSNNQGCNSIKQVFGQIFEAGFE